jgi:hypothetical protein
MVAWQAAGGLAKLKFEHEFERSIFVCAIAGAEKFCESSDLHSTYAYYYSTWGYDQGVDPPPDTI